MTDWLTEAFDFIQPDGIPSGSKSGSNDRFGSISHVQRSAHNVGINYVPWVIAHRAIFTVM